MSTIKDDIEGGSTHFAIQRSARQARHVNNAAAGGEQSPRWNCSGKDGYLCSANELGPAPERGTRTIGGRARGGARPRLMTDEAVSYTHLTLPTIRSV